MAVDVPFVLLNFLDNILGLELGRPTFLIHNVDSLLLSPDLTINVLDLAP